MTGQAVTQLERAVPVILIANLPTCFLGFVGWAIALDDAGRWTSNAILPLLLFSYLPLASIAVIIGLFGPLPQSVRHWIYRLVLVTGLATLGTTVLVWFGWVG